ncbi:uncharacterized protein, partial [Choristoneura fumiferana]|uniref:uncharacterized protein n=1 Tax=Choristoneura fumiferana TaxID=7141 RepID=UPI003D15AB91
MVQIMTGHGCFGHYLSRIGREHDPLCHHCGDPDDTAQHTLETCSSWDTERLVLAAALRTDDLSLSNIVSKMLESEESWNAVTEFCEEVMSRKEEAEREREEDPGAPLFR